MAGPENPRPKTCFRIPYTKNLFPNWVVRLNQFHPRREYDCLEPLPLSFIIKYKLHRSNHTGIWAWIHSRGNENTLVFIYFYAEFRHLFLGQMLRSRCLTIQRKNERKKKSAPTLQQKPFYIILHAISGFIENIFRYLFSNRNKMSSF